MKNNAVMDIFQKSKYEDFNYLENIEGLRKDRLLFQSWGNHLSNYYPVSTYIC